MTGISAVAQGHSLELELVLQPYLEVFSSYAH